MTYNKKIEQLIQEEIKLEREEDKHDERFVYNNGRYKNNLKKYREWAIASLKGNNIIK